MSNRQRKKRAKVLSLANCGMGAAVGIEVIREHVLGFLSVPLTPALTTLGGGFIYSALGLLVCGPQRKQYLEHRMILLANLPWGGERRDGGATNWLRRGLIKAGWVTLLDCSF